MNACDQGSGQNFEQSPGQEQSSGQSGQSVVIRFAGDSGDGMQITGARFSAEAGSVGNDLRTLPDFPAEIRAPAGTMAGVSAFQLHFGDHTLFTPGDAVDVLVAMNPAALRANLDRLRPGGWILANTAQFGARNLTKAGYPSDPLQDGSLAGFSVQGIDINKMTEHALAGLGLATKAVDRCKNFFALGVVFWIYTRNIEPTMQWLRRKFAAKPELAEANCKVLQAGYNYGETAELFGQRFQIQAAAKKPGRYRNITGNEALALGLVAAGKQARLPVFFGAYPITPASDVLHNLAPLKAHGVRTFQAEDEIAAIGAAIGASFGGSLGVTCSSGPGIVLKAEALGLAIMAELPLVVINVQRGGPSTGLPTKTEQADLLMALYGRNSEAPIPVVAAATPADCFATIFEAARLAITYRTPVMMLSDGYIANGSEPWLVPLASDLPTLDAAFAEAPKIEEKEKEPAEPFLPYGRDAQTLARPWVRPGTPGLAHRIGGLEKEHLTGNVSYDPENHELMVRLRAEKVARMASKLPSAEDLLDAEGLVVDDQVGDDQGDLLLVGWGSTQGALREAAMRLRRKGYTIGIMHIRHVHPLPAGLADVFARFASVAVAELNMGQLSVLLRAETLVDIASLLKVRGQPFRAIEVVEKAEALIAAQRQKTSRPSPFISPTLEPVLAELSA